jgi:voltage-gated sodium channel
MASYLLTNLLVGIVLKALEDAHQAERPAGPGTAPEPARTAVVAVPAGHRVPRPGASLRELRTALDALEAELAGQAPAGGADRRPTGRRPKSGRRAARAGK